MLGLHDSERPCDEFCNVVGSTTQSIPTGFCIPSVLIGENFTFVGSLHCRGTFLQCHCYRVRNFEDETSTP